jgi:tetratricopeptide (TPR) repeat protein
VTTAVDSESLTETGLAVGSPAYMSPEQGAGAVDLDGRSDLYSLGCVLYEMLSGETPYTGRTPQAILAKKLTEPLPRITAVRAAVPAAVEAALERVLSRNAADRFATAQKFTAALSDPHAATSRPGRRIGRRMAIVAGAVVALIVLGGYGSWWFLATGKPGTVFASGAMDRGDRVLVAGFVNRTNDAWLADVVREGIRFMLLQDPKLVRPVDPADVERALERMRQPPDAAVDRETALILAEREGIKAVVTGEITSVGSGYQVAVRVLSAADRRELLVVQEWAASKEDLLRVADRLGKQLGRQLGQSVRAARSLRPLPDVSTASLEALHHYAASIGNPSDAIAELRQAIELDSTFAFAYARLANMLNNTRAGTVSEARVMAARAYEFRERLPDIERLWVEALYYDIHQQTEPAARAYEMILDLDWTDQRALPNLKGALLHLSDLRLAQRKLAAAESLALRLIDLEAPDSPNYFACWNALEAQVAQERFAAADSLVRREPPCQRQEQLAYRVLAARRDYQGGERYLRSWLRGGLRPTNADSFFVLYETLPAVLTVQGRLAEARGYWSRYVTRWVVMARRALFWAGYEYAYAGDTARASSVIDSVLRGVNLDTLSSKPALYERLVPFLAQVGRVAEARTLLEDWMTLGDPSLDRLRWESLGWIALAEGHLDSAAVAFRAWNAAPDISSEHTYNRGWVEAGVAYDRAGMVDSAIALYERGLRMPYLDGADYEIRWYPGVLRRLGELYEQQGQREKAVDYYGRFVELWKDADPELQPQVEEARAAVRRMTAGPR